MQIDADARPVAIYGANGAGKTNILEAISMLSPGRGLRRASAQEMTRRPEALGWKITAELQTKTQTHEVETQSINHAARQVRIDGKSASQIALGQIAPMLWLIPSMDRLWIEGADGRRRFLDRMVLSFEPTHATHVLTYEKAMRERNRLLKDQVRDDHWYIAIERQMAESGVEILAARQRCVDHLMAAQLDAETSFPTAALSLSHPEIDELPSDALSLAGALAAGRVRDFQMGRTSIGPHRQDMGAIFTAKDVPAKDCSTGEQKALLISLILSNGRALRDDRSVSPILLLDEIAAHLDATRRAALYDEITALGAQAWMTGTGVDLFSELGNRAQYVDVSEQDGKSQVTQR